MFIHGKPVVPPGCPVEQYGFIPDLAEAPFSCIVGDATVGPDGHDTEIEITLEFGVPDDDGKGLEQSDFITSGTEVPVDSDLAQKAHELVGHPSYRAESRIIKAESSPLARQLRTLFCDRVAECRGIVDGDCWALGASAIREVVRQVQLDN